MIKTLADRLFPYVSDSAVFVIKCEDVVNENACH